jgi:U3 small nucleolar RNA-associated protein 13
MEGASEGLEQTFALNHQHTMATRVALKTTFEADEVIQPVFTGGSVGIDKSSRILATTLGEDAVLTDLITGRRLALIEGDGEVISTLTCR